MWIWTPFLKWSHRTRDMAYTIRRCDTSLKLIFFFEKPRTNVKTVLTSEPEIWPIYHPTPTFKNIHEIDIRMNDNKIFRGIFNLKKSESSSA